MDVLRVDDPSVMAVPLYLVAMVLEFLIGRRVAGWLGYGVRDTVASLLTGVVSLVTVGVAGAGAAMVAAGLVPWRVFEFEGVVAWIVGAVVWDFVYYWVHRFEHQVRLGWASHVGHHSSRRFNFSTALRQPLLPWPALVVFPWLVLTGVPPDVLVACGGFNLLYQFFIHTELVGKLPRWVEAVFNTPSHHRVHHGSNPRYLDRNHGGVLIVWDRLFGTFQGEDEAVVYGLTRGGERYGVWDIFVHEYRDIVRDVRRADGWRGRLRAVFGRP